MSESPEADAAAAATWAVAMPPPVEPPALAAAPSLSVPFSGGFAAAGQGPHAGAPKWAGRWDPMMAVAPPSSLLPMDQVPRVLSQRAVP